MDEPFGALDAMTRDVLHDELERLWRETGLSVVFVTHNVREAVRLGDRVVLLSSRPGRIVEEYPIDIPDRGASIRSRSRGSRRRSPTASRTKCVVMAVEDRDLAQLSSGLDALEVPRVPKVSRGRKIWRSAWPKLLAIAIFLAFWQSLIWVEWKPSYALASPADTFSSLFNNWGVISDAMVTTLGRGIQGYAIAIVIGVAIGAAVARIAVLRAAIGSMITGLQTMPSVAWYPLALLLFKLSEGAIFFVIVIGAAPSIANGLINGVDNISPVLLRAGKVLGARRFDSFRYVILPAAMPSFVGGLKQGWAFAWRSLLAGEIIGGIAGYSLGQQLAANRDLADAAGVQSVMIVLFGIGVLVDVLVFSYAERRIRTRYGLVDVASTA